MKKCLVLLMMGMGVLPLFPLDLTIVSTKGKVEIQTPGGEWSRAEAGQVISSQSIISTGFQSEALLRIEDSEVVIQALSRMRLDSIEESPQTMNTSLFLQTGIVRARIRKSKRNLDFRITTPVATAAVRGTDFVLNPYRIKVTQGLVSFSQGKNTVHVSAGTSSWARKVQKPTNPQDGIHIRGKISPLNGARTTTSKYKFPDTSNREEESSLTLRLE